MIIVPVAPSVQRREIVWLMVATDGGDYSRGDEPVVLPCPQGRKYIYPLRVRVEVVSAKPGSQPILERSTAVENGTHNASSLRNTAGRIR